MYKPKSCMGLIKPSYRVLLKMMGKNTDNDY